MKHKKVYIETYGCQMNEYDSGVVGKLLANESFELVSDASASDVILLNTCAVRENAHEKIYSRLMHIGAMKNKNPGMVVGILGCMAQNLKEDIFSKGLPVDLVLGPDNYRDLAGMIRKLDQKQEKLDLTVLSKEETYEEVRPGVINGISAFVTIMRGCNNFCTFCVVPYTRGRERSKKTESIIEEINDLVAQGVSQITLLGQNVNSYKYQNIDFTSLVEKILQETTVKRIRFTSPHPKDFPLQLMQLMKQNKRFSNNIHLPLQAGSDKVLKEMKRNYTVEEFLQLVDTIRSIIPDVGLTTDVIVGFPNETDEDFQKTLDVMQRARFDMAFMFKYSEREDTVAQRLYQDNVDPQLKSKRLTALVDLQNSISLQENTKKIGETFEVLIEGKSKKSDQEFSGRTNSGRMVVFAQNNSDYAFGDMVKVKILSATSATLKGEIV